MTEAAHGKVWSPSDSTQIDASCIEIVDETGSTQDDTLKYPPVNSPRVLVARVQTAGRALNGPFHYFPNQFCGSFVFPLEKQVIDTIEAATALAALHILREAEPAEKFEIAYPNSIMRNGRKIGGILAETSQNYVIGVGINQGVSGPKFGATATPIPPRKLASDLLEGICKNMCDPEVHARFYAEVRERDTTLEHEGEQYQVTGIHPPCLLALRRVRDGARFWTASILHFAPQALK